MYNIFGPPHQRNSGIQFKCQFWPLTRGGKIDRDCNLIKLGQYLQFFYKLGKNKPAMLNLDKKMIRNKVKIIFREQTFKIFSKKKIILVKNWHTTVHWGKPLARNPPVQMEFCHTTLWCYLMWIFRLFPWIKKSDKIFSNMHFINILSVFHSLDTLTMQHPMTSSKWCIQAYKAYDCTLWQAMWS